MSFRRTASSVIALALLSITVTANAQPIGTFRWQLQPYCNVLTLQVVQQGSVYSLLGTDDRCGSPSAASAVGDAFLNPNGSIGFGITTVVLGGTAVHVSASINPSTLSGAWSDSSGNSGTMVFTPGASTGGTPRPVAPGGVAPASIAAVHLAPGAVGAAAIAANVITSGNVADGSLTYADIGDAPRLVSVEPAGVPVTSSGPTVVAATTLVAPAAGRVLVNASGTFSMAGADLKEVYCSLTTGLTVGTFSAQARFVGDIQMPFGAARTFSVAAGSTTTFRLVCQTFTGVVQVFNPVLTALFVAGS